MNSEIILDKFARAHNFLSINCLLQSWQKQEISFNKTDLIKIIDLALQEARIPKEIVFVCPTCKKKKEPTYCQSCVDWLLKEAHKDDKRKIKDLKNHLVKEPEKKVKE